MRVQALYLDDIPLHPGRPRPGLIEAPALPPLQLDFVAQACIRGVRAPASLKRHSPTGHSSNGIETGHPGRPRPGLIEARAAYPIAPEPWR